MIDLNIYDFMSVSGYFGYLEALWEFLNGKLQVYHLYQLKNVETNENANFRPAKILIPRYFIGLLMYSVF